MPGRNKRKTREMFLFYYIGKKKRKLRFRKTLSFELDLNQRPRDYFGYPLQSPALPTELSKELVIPKKNYAI